MASRIFTSNNGRFRLDLPLNWDEYDLQGEEGSYGFFNSQSSHWTGNLRVTPLILSPALDDHNRTIEKFIDDELAKHDGAIKIKMGDADCVFYKEEKKFEHEPQLLYYWITGKQNFLFVCSFTIDKRRGSTKENRLELAAVEDIIKSIRLV